MDTESAVRALGALAQPSRLETFKLLVRRGEEGMAAGEIARALGIPANTLSAHLGVLSRAELVRSRREGRSIVYFLDLAGTRRLLGFLMEDCCRGRTELCEPLLTALFDGGCQPAGDGVSHTPRTEG